MLLERNELCWEDCSSNGFTEPTIKDIIRRQVDRYLNGCERIEVSGTSDV